MLLISHPHTTLRRTRLGKDLKAQKGRRVRVKPLCPRQRTRPYSSHFGVRVLPQSLRAHGEDAVVACHCRRLGAWPMDASVE